MLSWTLLLHRSIGWTNLAVVPSTLASVLARSTPRLIRSFSIAEIVDWWIPDASARLFWLISWSSQTILTDSPTDRSIHFLAGLKSLISFLPIIASNYPDSRRPGLSRLPSPRGYPDSRRPGLDPGSIFFPWPKKWMAQASLSTGSRPHLLPGQALYDMVYVYSHIFVLYL